MKVLSSVSACVVGLVAYASLAHAAIQGVSLTIVDKTSRRPVTVQANTVEAISLARTATRVKSVDIVFTVGARSSPRRLSLVSRSQSLLRSEYDAVQGAIAQGLQVAITATAVRMSCRYTSNIDVWPLILNIGAPTPTPSPTPSPTPTPTPTPDRVVLDQLVGDFSVDALKLYDTSVAGTPLVDGAIRSVALVQQSGALAIEVGFALGDGSPLQLSITGAEADAVRSHYQAIGDVLRTGQSFWLTTTAYQDGTDPVAYRAVIESSIVKIQVLPNKSGSGMIPNVALTVSPGSGSLVIADGVQTVETGSIEGTVTLRVSFFIPGDSNHHWLTLKGSRDAVFTQFSSMVNSINSRWRFGLYAYSDPSADGVFYEGTLGVHTLILSLEHVTGAALPGMAASAIAEGATAFSGMPVRSICYYSDASGPYLWAQGTDASGNDGGLIMTHATWAFYDNVVSVLQASDVMSSTLAGYGTAHSTWPNTYVVDLDLNGLYLTAGFTPPAPERMGITVSYVGETPITSSRVNSTNVNFTVGSVVSDSYFISSADGTQRLLTLTGSSNLAVQTTFDRILRGIAAGKHVSIEALNASPSSSDGFVVDVGSPSFVLTIQ